MGQDGDSPVSVTRLGQSPLSLHLAIFLISAVGIAYQVVLMRIFSIAQWHHFAYMIISIAMLGFGASGATLAMVKERIKGHEGPLLRVAALLLSFGLIGSYALSQRIPFETFQLVSQPLQPAYLLALYVILSIPFFLVSTCITLGFFLEPDQVGRLYFFNMAGSGVGAAGVIGLLYVAHPGMLVFPLAFMAAFGYLLLVWGECKCPSAFRRRALWGIIRVCGLYAGLTALSVFCARQPSRISQYKGLSYALQFPDAKVVAQKASPLSVVTAVASKQIRETPGQVSNYAWRELGPLPEQVGLYFDAGAVSPVNRFDGSLEPFAYLDYVTGAVAYRLVERPQVLVVGAGGGTDVLAALFHGAEHVTAVEVDPSVHTLLETSLREFSGRLQERPDVTWVLAEGRGLLQSRDERYDLIQIALLDAFNASAAGVHALNESYLYTVEAVSLYLSRLTSNGVLALTRWLKTPPRDALRMFATAVEACERLGIADPACHLVFIRSWNTGTIVVSRSPLTKEQIRAVRAFCLSRGFDLCYYPGITSGEANQYTVLERPVYYEFARAVLSPERESLYRNAVFYLRPATDNRPYFFRFFKWASLPRLVRGMGTEWVPFVEWGYITLVATLVQSVLASVALILLPLAALARRSPVRRAKRWVFVYFAGLGCAYMFLEIAFIQRFMLFLAYPIYAVAVVLTAFLIFSGMGSLFADRIRERRTRAVGLAVLAIAVLAVVYLISLPGVFSAWAGWGDEAKILASIALLAPLAFCMGIPFPTGLQLVSDDHEALLPWAWGINGCASVIGATLATLIAVHLGFRLLVGSAVLAYTVSAVGLQRLARLTSPVE